MEERNPNSQQVSSATAVLVGALASGVNVSSSSPSFDRLDLILISKSDSVFNLVRLQGPTWSVIKAAFFALALSLAAMSCLAFLSKDLAMALHVFALVAISAALFFLLNRFLAETGLVSVEQQMQEMGLAPNDQDKQNKRE
ncbi:hypothetical protein Syun_008468 [Stephania yunnanensis]|uniref:Uncharacterized protein n=1 Tax=Stephania yunnanensis TaxID=152371 RepID=A0AAP0PPM7_9MAGN